MDLIISLFFLSSAVISIFMIIFSLKTGKILSNAGMKMKMVRKEDNPKSYWLGFAGFLIFGIIFLILGVICLFNC